MLEYVSEEWFTMLVSSCLSPGVSLGIEVHQTPSELIRKPGDHASLVCRHGETDYRVMLWYQQSAGQRDLILIGHLHYQSIYVESAFEKDFSFSGDLSGDTAKNISLLGRLKDPVSNGMDYCAASVARQHTPTATQNKNQKLCGSYPRWFGMETSCQVFPRPPALEANFCFILVSTNRVLYFLPTNAHCLLIKTLPTHVLSSAANQSTSSQNTIRKDNKNIPSTRGCSLVVLCLSHTKIVSITSSLLNICTK